MAKKLILYKNTDYTVISKDKGIMNMRLLSPSDKDKKYLCHLTLSGNMIKNKKFKTANNDKRKALSQMLEKLDKAKDWESILTIK